MNTYKVIYLLFSLIAIVSFRGRMSAHSARYSKRAVARDVPAMLATSQYSTAVHGIGTRESRMLPAFLSLISADTSPLAICLMNYPGTLRPRPFATVRGDETMPREKSEIEKERTNNKQANEPNEGNGMNMNMRALLG